jgi:hypothetical protein
MKDPNIIQESDFSYEVYRPSVGGDSGVLMLATKMSDPSIQYIVKCQVDWNPVSEFIYHKVAAALGLYTQEVKLFKKLMESKYACGIRYCGNAEKVGHIRANDPIHRDYFKFMALFQILNEEDSEEFYIDKDNRFFKLDNAEAFMLSITCGLLIKKAKTKSQWVKMAIDEELEKYQTKINFEFYTLMDTQLSDVFGAEAIGIYRNTFRQFSDLDLSILDHAFASLDRVYPKTFSEYLRHYLENRQTACREFSAAINQQE